MSNQQSLFSERYALNIVIFLAFAYFLFPLVFDKLLSDELFFLGSAYDLANNAATSFNLSQANYVNSIYELILALFLKEPYWVQGVIVFKYLNYFLILSLPFLYCAVASKQSFFNQKISTVLLTCILILYIGSQRNIEIRPESFASIALFFGAIFLITPQQTSIRKYYISATLLLLSAYLSMRAAPFSVLILMYGIASLYNELNHIKNKRNHIIALCIVLIAIIYNMVDFWLTGINAYNASTEDAVNIVNASFKEVLIWKMNLGLNFIGSFYSPNFRLRWLFFVIRNLSIIITCIASLYLFIQIFRKKIKKETAPLLALPGAWLVLFLIIDKLPYSYVVIIETTILTIFWTAVFQQKLITCNFSVSIRTKQISYFLWFILMIATVFGAHTITSRSDYHRSRGISYLGDFNQDTIKQATNAVVIAYTGASTLKDQLLARQEICRRFPNVATIFGQGRNLICKKNFFEPNYAFQNFVNADVSAQFIAQPMFIIDNMIADTFVVPLSYKNFPSITVGGINEYFTKGIDLNAKK